MVNTTTVNVIGHADFCRLDIHEQAVLMYLLCRRNGNTGQCNPSLTDILRLGMCKNTMRKRLNRLEKSGWIVRHRGGGRGHSTLYEITTPDEHETGSPRAPVYSQKTGSCDAPDKNINRVTGCAKQGHPVTHERKNVKDRVRTQQIFNEDSPEYRLAVALWDDITKHGTAAKPPDMETWAAVFDSIHRLDGHPYHWIKQIMLSARERDPWLRDNMKSPGAARKWINAGRLDKYTPAEYMTDAEVLAAITAEAGTA